MKIARKNIGVLLLIGLLVGLLSATSSHGQMTIKFGHTDTPQPFDSPGHAWALMFKHVLDRETQGQIKVNVFPSSQLGREREMMEALKIGSIETMSITEGTLVNFFPPLEVLGIPYLYPSIDVGFKVMDGPFGRELKETMLKETGMRVIATAAPGPLRNFGAKKALRKVEDLKGLRIRTMEHPGHQAMVRALGASPTPLPFGEVYSALKSGVIDGIELPYQATLNMKLDEVVKYMIADGHIFNQMFMLINEKWFRSLSADQQRAVFKAGSAAQYVGRAVVRIWEAAGPEELRAKGVQLYFPTEQELKAFRDLGQPPVLAMVRQRIDKKWIDGILKAVEDASKEQ